MRARYFSAPIAIGSFAKIVKRTKRKTCAIATVTTCAKHVDKVRQRARAATTEVAVYAKGMVAIYASTTRSTRMILFATTVLATAKCAIKLFAQSTL